MIALTSSPASTGAAMTNTIPNVPRELLERAAYTLELAYEVDTPTVRDIRALLSAPSPAGVDGLEVVGWYRMDDRKAITPYPSVCATWHKMGVKVGAAYSDSAQAIIDGLRWEVADLLSMLATVSKAGLRVRTERDQQAQRIGELEGLLRDSAELIKHGVFEDGYCCCGSSVDSHGLGYGHSPVDALAYHAGQVCERIDAALSAGKEKQDERS